MLVAADLRTAADNVRWDASVRLRCDYQYGIPKIDEREDERAAGAKEAVV